METSEKQVAENRTEVSPNEKAYWLSYSFSIFILVLYFFISWKNLVLPSAVFYVVKILVCFSIGILSTLLTGFIEVVLKSKLPYDIQIKAAQGFAVALLTFIFWPDPNNWDYKVVSYDDVVDFRSWVPYSSTDDCDKSIVYRTVKMQIEKNPNAVRPFKEIFGTTNDRCQLEYNQLNNGFAIDMEKDGSVLPPRKEYDVVASPNFFENDKGTISYSIKYFNNFDLLHPLSEKNDVTKKFQNFVSSYNVQMLFSPQFKWKKIRLKFPSQEDMIFINLNHSNTFRHTLKNILVGTMISYYIEI